MEGNNAKNALPSEQDDSEIWKLLDAETRAEIRRFVINGIPFKLVQKPNYGGYNSNFFISRRCRP